MNENTIAFLKLAKRIYNKVERTLKHERNEILGLDLTCSGEEANELIRSKIIDDKPCMVCRFGSTELSAVIRYINVTRASKFPLDKSLNYVMSTIGNISGTLETGAFWWDETIKIEVQNNSGFFPVTNQALEAFGRRMLKDIENIDVLGSWIKQEVQTAEFIKKALIVGLGDLEPYYHINPWSEALRNKVVLVIHPFEQSIQQQYQRRQLLFKDQRILPEFELKTLKAVQSLGGNNNGFNSWFDALDWMCDQVAKIEFDVAIIGAGAYGLPLASYVKNLGKKSIHLGGATQILFGIKGKRWDERPFFQGLYNQYWVKPLPSELPENRQTDYKVLGYW
jgi:hypothetical protein